MGPVPFARCALTPTPVNTMSNPPPSVCETITTITTTTNVIIIIFIITPAPITLTATATKNQTLQ